VAVGWLCCREVELWLGDCQSGFVGRFVGKLVLACVASFVPCLTRLGSRCRRAWGGYRFLALSLTALAAASASGVCKRYGRRLLQGGGWGASKRLRGHPQRWQRVVYPQ
jgi:hypothetical protein